MHFRFSEYCVLLLFFIPLLTLPQCHADPLPNSNGKHAKPGKMNADAQQVLAPPMQAWINAREKAETAEIKARRMQGFLDTKQKCVTKNMKYMCQKVLYLSSHEEKMRQKRIKKLKQDLKKKKKAVKAMYEKMQKPVDLFSSFPASFMKRAKKKFSSEQLVQYVQAILRTGAAGKSLNRVEKVALKSASKGIKSVLFTPNCAVFFSKMYGELSVCCRVAVEPSFFGMCIPLRLLRLEEKMMHKLAKKKMGGIPDKVKGEYLSMSARYYSPAPESSKWGESNDLVAVIDLFAVPCSPAIDNGLCSQYVSHLLHFILSFPSSETGSNHRSTFNFAQCCQPRNRYSSFCSSFMDCY